MEMFRCVLTGTLHIFIVEAESKISILPFSVPDLIQDVMKFGHTFVLDVDLFRCFGIGVGRNILNFLFLYWEGALRICSNYDPLKQR